LLDGRTGVGYKQDIKGYRIALSNQTRRREGKRMDSLFEGIIGILKPEIKSKTEQDDAKKFT
jgi:hypothetical protein